MVTIVPNIQGPSGCKFLGIFSGAGLHNEQFFRHRLIPKQCYFDIVFGLHPILFDIFIG